MKLNLCKKSGLHLTPVGDKEYVRLLNTEIDIDPEMLDMDQSIEMQIASGLPEEHDTWLMSALEEVATNSGTTIEEIVQGLRNDQFPEESISLLIASIYSQFLLAYFPEDQILDLQLIPVVLRVVVKL